MAKNSFPQEVYRLTRHIPRGRVNTYSDIAAALGRPGASRAVGNALHRNPYAPQVPCHRVVKKNGEIGGFASGNSRKIAMLKEEGIIIKKGRLDIKIYAHRLSIKRKSKKRP